MAQIEVVSTCAQQEVMSPLFACTVLSSPELEVLRLNEQVMACLGAVNNALVSIEARSGEVQKQDSSNSAYSSHSVDLLELVGKELAGYLEMWRSRANSLRSYETYYTSVEGDHSTPSVVSGLLGLREPLEDLLHEAGGIAASYCVAVRLIREGSESLRSSDEKALEKLLCQTRYLLYCLEERFYTALGEFVSFSDKDNPNCIESLLSQKNTRGQVILHIHGDINTRPRELSQGQYAAFLTEVLITNPLKFRRDQEGPVEVFVCVAEKDGVFESLEVLSATIPYRTSWWHPDHGRKYAPKGTPGRGFGLRYYSEVLHRAGYVLSLQAAAQVDMNRLCVDRE